MNLSINGQSQIPPGFRFHPTEEELLHYYLRKKVAYEKIDLDVIGDIDLNKLEPWDIQEKCKIGSTPQNDWYFFSHKDKKYPTGTRTNRATTAGFWKATGRDKIIYSGLKRIGLRKTLVFYKGRAPHGQKSDWIMHEYRLDDGNQDTSAVQNAMGQESIAEDGWVVCRVFKKKNYQKSLDSPKNSSTTSIESTTSQLLGSSSEGVLDQILQYMGKTCKLESESSLNHVNISSENNNDSTRFFNGKNNNGFFSDGVFHDRFMHLPRLETPNLSSFPTSMISASGSSFDQDCCFKANNCYSTFDEILLETSDQAAAPTSSSKVNNWVDLDRLVASQLNGQDHDQEETISKQFSCFVEPTNMGFCQPNDHDNHHDVDEVDDDDNDDVRLLDLRPSRSLVYSCENDLWNLTKSSYSPSSSSDPLCHLSV